LKKQLKDIFNTYYAPLCNYAISLIKDRQQAEDIVQTIFIQLWENEKILELAIPGPYLMRCVKFKCIDQQRSSKPISSLPIEQVPDPTTHINEGLKEEDILPLISYIATKLPPKMQKVFLLSRLGNKSYKEIAEELNISVKTVENHMGAALKKLRNILKDAGYLSIAAFAIPSH